MCFNCSVCFLGGKLELIFLRKRDNFVLHSLLGENFAGTCCAVVGSLKELAFSKHVRLKKACLSQQKEKIKIET